MIYGDWQLIGRAEAGTSWREAGVDSEADALGSGESRSDEVTSEGSPPFKKGDIGGFGS